MEFLILLTFFLFFGAWSFRKIFRAIAKDRKIKVVWMSFARAKNLTETVLEQNESGITKITMTVLKQGWSRNPVKSRPGVGSHGYSGTNNGLPFFMDSVQIKKRWTDLMDTYTRMAIKVPDPVKRGRLFPTLFMNDVFNMSLNNIWNKLTNMISYRIIVV